MNKIIKSLVIALIFLASCEKISDQEKYILKFYGDAYNDIAYSATIVSDGYVIAGQFAKNQGGSGNNVSLNKNMGIIKTDWGGNVKWKVSAGGKYDDWGSMIYQNADSSLICVGTTTDTTSLTTDVFAVKVSSAGEVEWKKNYGGTGNQTGIDIAKTSDGYLILGTTDIERAPAADSIGNPDGKTDIFILKINDNGDFVNSNAYGYWKDDQAKVIKQDIDGNFIVFGTVDNSTPTQNNHDLILIKINSSGYAIQTKMIVNADDEYAADMEVLQDGYLLAYTVGAPGSNQQIYVKKMNTDIYAAPVFTNPITITNPGSTDNSAAVFAISKYKTDSFLLAGESGKISPKLLVFEIDASGNPVAGHQIIRGSTGTQVVYDVVSGDDGFIIAVGKNSLDVNSMMTFLKFKF
jgi:hypothetical protein